MKSPKNNIFVYDSRFELGDTVVFDTRCLDPAFWDNLTEDVRIKYYGPLGYGEKDILLFTFICEHRPQSGHCVLVNMKNQKIETMRHIECLRLATEDEC